MHLEFDLYFLSKDLYFFFEYTLDRGVSLVRLCLHLVDPSEIFSTNLVLPKAIISHWITETWSFGIRNNFCSLSYQR